MKSLLTLFLIIGFVSSYPLSSELSDLQDKGDDRDWESYNDRDGVEQRELASSQWNNDDVDTDFPEASINDDMILMQLDNELAGEKGILSLQDNSNDPDIYDSDPVSIPKSRKELAKVGLKVKVMRKKGRKPKSSEKKGGKPKQTGKKGRKPKQSGKKGVKPMPSGKKGGRPKHVGKKGGKLKPSGKKGVKPKQSGKKRRKPKQSGNKGGKPKQSGKKGGKPKQSGKKGGKPKE